MPLLLKYTTPQRAIWKIEESSEELLKLLDRKEEYLPALSSLHTEKRKQEWLAVRVLLRELLGEEKLIAYHANGAPYLPDAPFYISLSHTHGYVAVLLQEQPFVGIDIEERGDRILRVRSRFMSKEEEAIIVPGREIEHLLVYWCAKEALFKMIGQEGVDFQTHLKVYPFSLAQSGALLAQETHTSAARTFCLCYEILPEFVWVWSIGENSR